MDEKNILKSVDGMEILCDFYEKRYELPIEDIFTELLKYEKVSIFLELYSSSAFQIEDCDFTIVHGYYNHTVGLRSGRLDQRMKLTIDNIEDYDYDFFLDEKYMEIEMKDTEGNEIVLQLGFDMEYCYRSEDDYKKELDEYNHKTKSGEFMSIPSSMNEE